MSVRSSLLAIQPERGEAVISFVEGLLERTTVSELAAMQKEVPEFKALITNSDAGEKPYELISRVAVIPLVGDMTNRPNCMMMLYGGRSTAMARVLVAKATRDVDVKNICLEFDSYGGEVDGIAELSETILRARQAGKQVWGFVSPNCHSAAYWVACHCDKIILSSPNAFVGSLGVVLGLCDRSGLPSMMGVKWYKIATGPSKGVGMHYSAITDENIAVFEREVQYVGQEFAKVVKAGRGIDAKLGEGVMDGSSWHGHLAIALGLADAIATREDVIAALADENPEDVLITLPASDVEMDDEGHPLDEVLEDTDDPETEATTAQPVGATGEALPQPTLTGENTMEKNLLKAAAPKTGIQALLASWLPGGKAAEEAVASAAVGFEAQLAELQAEVDRLTPLAADGEQARLLAIEDTFNTIIRAAGLGAITLEAVQEKLEGKSLEQIEAEVGPYLKIAESNFTPVPTKPKAVGRATVEVEAKSDEDEDEAEVPVKAKATAKKETADQRATRLEREYARL